MCLCVCVFGSVVISSLKFNHAYRVTEYISIFFSLWKKKKRKRNSFVTIDTRLENFDKSASGKLTEFCMQSPFNRAATVRMTRKQFTIIVLQDPSKCHELQRVFMLTLGLRREYPWISHCIVLQITGSKSERQ